MQLALYIASVIGALALVMMMPRQRYNLATAGALLGAATLGAVWLVLSSFRTLGRFEGMWHWIEPGSGERTVMLYYYVFSALAIVGAVRVITHTRPVYAALWFVLVVLSSAGLFLTLSAEFMAFAMIIIYAGAILVTYMFVIMLATQSENPDFRAAAVGLEHAETGGYDRVAREPVAATAAGFLLLAVLLTVSVDETRRPNPAAAAANDATIVQNILPARAVDRFARAEDPTAASAPLTSAERVGLELFARHPLGIELAAVILTVALVGAIVIARTRVPEEAGPAGRARPDSETGATVSPDGEPGPADREAIGAVGGRLGP
jgi:NADH-quinone oxidoreductase subunit J